MAIYKALLEKLYTTLNLLTMGLLGGVGWGAAHGFGGTKKAPSLKYVLHILQ